jgi:hypothetical protein
MRITKHRSSVSGGRRWSITLALAALAAVFALVPVAWACNVPVFRFALEKWRPDPYQAVLFHRGELTADHRAVVQPLADLEEQSRGNMALRLVDVNQLEAAGDEGKADADLFASLGDVSLPALAVQYPAHLKIAKPVWSGSPSPEAIGGLVDSPVRQELIRRLVDGQTAVWLFLESGNKEQDDLAAGLVEGQLKILEQELELPELTDAPEDAIAAKAPLQIAFSLLRVRRDDPAEQALVAMLLGSESDLAERTDPMAFPVYGRGRALWALVGAGITEKNVRDSAGFLVAPCSCEVKELNPGFDLLLSADWDILLSADGTPLAAEATSDKVPAEAEFVPIPTGTPAAAAPSPAAATAGAPPTGAELPATVTVVVPTVVKRTPLPTFLIPRWVWFVGGAVVIGIVAVVVVAAAQGRDREGA